jgi:hypothetical protein
VDITYKLNSVKPERRTNTLLTVLVLLLAPAAAAVVVVVAGIFPNINVFFTTRKVSTLPTR